MPLTQCASLPFTIVSNSLCPTHTLFFGFDSIDILLNTGSEFQYFNPNHSRLDAIFSCVTVASSMSAADVEVGMEVAVRRRGGVGPPRVTEER